MGKKEKGNSEFGQTICTLGQICRTVPAKSLPTSRTKVKQTIVDIIVNFDDTPYNL
ncbi:hypothetical protein CDL15_Pgr003174 [Punica granatum]|uniref:Uncharacterized protein n=1 Tax=Punica granatum TaxID=22663 RepID=A0A218X221_PUNGR|nr:hypothetical protein CDL15_Pgr003174 [Punica granatum]